MSAPSPQDQKPVDTVTNTPVLSQIENVDLFRQIVGNINQELWGRGSTSRYLAREWAVETVHPEDRERFLSSLEKEVVEPVEGLYRIFRPDGSLRLLHCRRFSVRNSEGRAYRVVQIVRDLTGQRETEDLLRQAHKMEALERVIFATKGLGKAVGLGLGMVYGIVRQNRGSIDLQTEPGQGTVFRLCFPPGKEAEAQMAASAG